MLVQFWAAVKVGQVAPFGYWAYPILAFLTAIEGPLSILLAAAAASAGLLNPLLVFLFAASGNLAADTGWYLVGYLGKLEWFQKGGKWLGIAPGVFDELQDGIHRHAVKILFIAKVTNGFIVPVLVAAGIARVPWRRWFPFVALGEAAVTGLLITVTYLGAASLLNIEKGFEYLALVSSAIFLLGILFVLRGSALRQRVFGRLFTGKR